MKNMCKNCAHFLIDEKVHHMGPSVSIMAGVNYAPPEVPDNRIGECIRYPQSFEKREDQVCGEWDDR